MKQKNNPCDKLMPAIGQYINRLPKDVPIEETLSCIAKDLFDDASRMEILVKNSYESYFPSQNEGMRGLMSTLSREDARKRICYTRLIQLLLYSKNRTTESQLGSNFASSQIQAHKFGSSKHDICDFERTEIRV